MSTPKKATPSSLNDLLGKSNDSTDKDNDTTSTDSSSAQESDTRNPAENRVVPAVEKGDLKSPTSDKGPGPDEEDNSDQAPGDGIIKEEDVDDSEDVRDRRDIALDDVGVLSRVHKMSPRGMTVLNSYSGGEDRINHGKVNVEVKPLTDVQVHREREIQDETGKSRLLHPDVTKPAIPSDQATVQGTYVEHVYATPYDPEVDNR